MYTPNTAAYITKPEVIYAIGGYTAVAPNAWSIEKTEPPATAPPLATAIEDIQEAA